MIKFYKCSYEDYIDKVWPRQKAQSFYALHYNTSWTVDMYVKQFLKLNEQYQNKAQYIREVFTKLVNKN